MVIVAFAVRITPACAGKRSSPCGRGARVGDHPRVCGEKLRPAADLDLHLGSPPRVRGKGWYSICSRVFLRITPACAGKRCPGRGLRLATRDHPRVCGEKGAGKKSPIEVRGSPPRVRGKDAEPDAKRRPDGITPACAGKRLKRSHSIGHFSCILCLFHSVLHRASVSGGSRAGPCAPPCLPAQNAVPV